MTEITIRTQNNFDFLRLFGSIAVVFCHSYGLFNQENDNPITVLTNHHNGFFLLSIFFGLSGYLIAKSALSSRSILHYLWKRVLRVQPLQLLLGVLTIFILGIFFSTLPASEYFSSWKTWSYFRNVVPIFGIQYNLPGVFTDNLFPNSVNGSLWSLVDEERLYLLTVILCFKNKYWKYFFIVFVLPLNGIFLINHILHNTIPYIKRGNIFFNVVFLNAALFYVLNINFKKIGENKIIILLLLILFFILLRINNIEPILVIVAPFVIISFAYLKSFLNYTGKWGDFSAGIYMFSFPIQQILCTKNIGVTQPFTLFVYTFLITFPLAILSWHFFEKQLLKYKNLVK